MFGVEVVSSILIRESSDRAEVEVLEIDHRHIVDAVSGGLIIKVMGEPFRGDDGAAAGAFV